MSATPSVSVVVPVYLSHATVRVSLQSLTTQRFRDFEVIVVDSSPDDRSEQIVRDAFPEFRYYRTPSRLLPHEARNWGVDKALGQILVFTDPDCVAEPDWLEHLVAAYRGSCGAVGGAIRSLPGWWNRAVQATKFSWWLPQAKPGPRLELPTANFSIRSSVWRDVQGFRGQYFAGDSEICWRIRRGGHTIWFEPRAIVTHLEHPPVLPFARERFRRGLDFGRMRVELQGWSRSRCLVYLLAAPLVPLLMTWRSARYAMSGGYLSAWMLTCPVQLLGNGLWSLGEAWAHGRAAWLS